MRPSLSALAIALLTTGACVFELAPLAFTGTGGSGGGAGGGGTGGDGGAPAVGYEILISYDGRNVPATQTEVPVLVRLDDSRLDYDLAASDGSDLRFFDEDGATPLAHEIERWSPTGTSLVWVRVPVVDVAGGSFRMRFGDPDASAPPPASEVWSRYEGVYHFADPRGQSAQDSVADADGTGTNTTSVDGPLGPAFAFDGTATVTVGNVTSFDVPEGGARTVSLWFQRATTMPLGMSVARTKNSFCDGWSFIILGDAFANLRMDIGIGSPCAATQNFNSNPFAMPGGQNDLDWHRATVVMDRQAGTTTFYLDAMVMDTSTIGTTGAMAGQDVVFGVGPFDGDTNFFIGNLDELRIGSEAFDASWVSLTHRLAQDQLLEYGTAQPLSP